MTSIVEKKEGEIEAAKRETFFNKKNLIRAGLGVAAIVGAYNVGPAFTLMIAGFGIYLAPLSKLMPLLDRRNLSADLKKRRRLYTAVAVAGASMALAGGLLIHPTNRSLMKVERKAQTLESEALQQIADGKGLVVVETTYFHRPYQSWKKAAEYPMSITAEVVGAQDSATGATHSVRNGEMFSVDFRAVNARSIKTGRRQFAFIGDNLYELTGKLGLVAVRGSTAAAVPASAPQVH